VSEESNVPLGTRRWWFIGAGVVVLAVLAWVILANLPGGRPTVAPPAPSATAPTTGPASTPIPTPSIPPPTATGTPTVEPTRKPSSVKTGLDNKVETSPGVTARVKSVEAVKGEARGPGEIAGPALRVTIAITNNGRRRSRPSSA